MNINTLWLLKSDEIKKLEEIIKIIPENIKERITIILNSAFQEIERTGWNLDANIINNMQNWDLKLDHNNYTSLLSWIILDDIMSSKNTVWNFIK